MHNGSLATPAAVIRHYFELDPDRLHSDGEAILRAQHFSEEEIAELSAFLASLWHRPMPGVAGGWNGPGGEFLDRSEEHTSELQSLMRNSYCGLCLKKKNKTNETRKDTGIHV